MTNSSHPLTEDRMQRKLATWRGPWLAGLALGAAILGWGSWQIVAAQTEEDSPKPQSAVDPSQAETSADSQPVDGRELFHRGWLPNDPRSPKGDGLGPMFNETSCAGCHNQGGPGGGGPASKNVDLLTAFVNQAMPNPGFRGNINTTSSGSQPGSGPAGLRRNPGNLLKQLTRIHPGFQHGSSVVVHQFGTSPKHTAWRDNLLSFQAQQQTLPGSFDSSIFLSPSAPSTEPEPAPRVNEELPPASIPQPSRPQPTQASADPPPPTFVPVQPNPGSPNDFPSQPQPPMPQQAPGTSFVFTPPTLQSPQGPFAITGNPLVDEAMQEMHRLQQQARKNVTSTSHRGQIVLHRSQRNTTALFGAGVVDAIPDEVIAALASKKHEDFPRVSGRVHRLPDGKIGKFGWKAQKATLRDFTLAACANELGLDVPGHSQEPVPYEKAEKAKGHDMTNKQADALVAYIRNLPAPIQETPQDKQAAKLIEQGQELFDSVGCAVCHTPNVGEAKGIYSDLLLHDLGDKLQASGSYGSILVPHQIDVATNGPQATPANGEVGPGRRLDPAPESREGAAVQTGTLQQAKRNGPTSGEWRTPPLWGLRDSAPYLHDGRASTMEQAIALHGGEGSDAAIRYFMLPIKKRQRVVAFLKTLRAPEQHSAR